MDDRSSKIYFGLCMLVLVWIGVYWAWEPGKSDKPKISIAPTEQPAQVDPEPESETQEQSISDPQPEQAKPEILDPPVQSVEIIPPKTGPRLIPPEFTTHTVAQGEILQTIAEKYYGKSNMWNVIARANPRIDPLKLRAGMTLRIPTDPNNIQGVVDSPENTQATNQEEPVVDYLVQSGDSLSLIAQRFYGSSKHANFIYESNRDILRSMDDISIGQTLKLPPLDP